MELIANGCYQQISEPKPMKPPSYFRLPNDWRIGQEVIAETVQLQAPLNCIPIKIPQDPVYVLEATNELVYNSTMMKNGKKYYVVWDNERFMLIKNDDNVEIYRSE